MEGMRKAAPAAEGGGAPAIPATMRAVVLERCCAPEELRVSCVPVPRPRPGWVLVRVRAFGLNRSELMLRAFEAAEPSIELPRIPGIECVGEVAAAAPEDAVRFPAGLPVAALMGGMGRSFDGGYAEYALLPVARLFALPAGLVGEAGEGDGEGDGHAGLAGEGAGAQMTWAEAAAVPETWFTAWGSLFECLRIRPGERLLVRGGGSALGIAAVQIAHALGCRVATTTRSASKLGGLSAVGADEVLLDADGFAEAARAAAPDGFDCVLDLVGAPTLFESMALAARPGRVCMTGLLGSHDALDGFDPIKDIPNGVALTGFFSNYPTQQAIDGIFGFIAAHGIRPLVGARYALRDIGRAHADMEANRIFGKAVVVP